MKPIRKEFIDVWYDLALEDLNSDGQVRSEPAVRVAFISNYIQAMETLYRVYKGELYPEPLPSDPLLNRRDVPISNDGRGMHTSSPHCHPDTLNRTRGFFRT